MPPRTRSRRLRPASPALLSTLAILALGCSGTPEPHDGAGLGAWGERMERRVEATAAESFRASPAARERFAAVYPAMHHAASVEAFFTGLEAEPELGGVARVLRASVDAELGAGDGDARAVRERWNDPAVQEAVARRIARAVVRALEATQAAAAMANGGGRAS